MSHLHRNPPELRLLSALEPSGISSAICARTLCNLVSYLRRNPLEPHQPSALEPSGTSSAICAQTLQNLICTRTLHNHPLSAPELTLRNFSHLHRTLRNLISHLRRNPLEPHQPSALEPSGTSSAICAQTLRNLICTRTLHNHPLSAPELTLRNFSHLHRTLRNLIGHLRRNPLEPHQPSALEPSGTSSAICAQTLRNLICTRTLHNHPLSDPELTLRNFSHLHRTLRNLISHLRGRLRNPPPEPGAAAAPHPTRPIEGQRPHSKLCCRGKT